MGQPPDDIAFSRRNALGYLGLLGADLALNRRGSGSSQPRRPFVSTALEMGGARQESILASGYTGTAGPADLIGLSRSNSPSMRKPTTYDAVPHNDNNFNKWEISGLRPGTTYYWQLTRNGSPTGPVVTAKTLRPIGEPCTTRIAGGGCQGTNPSDRAAFADAVAWGYDRFVHFGDDGYPLSLDTTLRSHERAYARAMTDPARGLIQPAGAVDKLISDHDCNFNVNSRYAGNDQNFNDPITAASLLAWADVVPVPMDDTRVPKRGRYWSCVEGNVRFIYTDTRDLDRTDVYDTITPPDDPSSTMLGATQLAWLLAEIDAAAAAGQFTQIFTDPGWNGIADVDHHGRIRFTNCDKWIAYTYERDLISAHIRSAYEAQGKSVNAAIAHSDTHAVQQDETHEKNGLIVWCCGPLERPPHCLPAFLEAYDFTYPDHKELDRHKSESFMLYQRMTWAEDPAGTLTLTVEARDCTPAHGSPHTLRTISRVYSL